MYIRLHKILGCTSVLKSYAHLYFHLLDWHQTVESYNTYECCGIMPFLNIKYSYFFGFSK